MSISNIEELDWFVQTEIGNIFMNNNKQGHAEPEDCVHGHFCDYNPSESGGKHVAGYSLNCRVELLVLLLPCAGHAGGVFAQERGVDACELGYLRLVEEREAVKEGGHVVVDHKLKLGEGFAFGGQHFLCLLIEGLEVVDGLLG